MSFVTHLSRRFRLVSRTYVGPMDKDVKKYRDPFTVKMPGGPRNAHNPIKMEAALDKLRDMIQTEVKQVSPFHLVWRHMDIMGMPWYDKVVLRRLGLHGLNGERVVIPNTPAHNRLLWQIKHAIRLKPVKFPDGMPTEADIGRTKVCVHSGKFEINDKFKVPEHRFQNIERQPIYHGRYLRDYLHNLSGIFAGCGN